MRFDVLRIVLSRFPLVSSAPFGCPDTLVRL